MTYSKLAATWREIAAIFKVAYNMEPNFILVIGWRAYGATWQPCCGRSNMGSRDRT